jgi:hypothetical protein
MRPLVGWTPAAAEETSRLFDGLDIVNRPKDKVELIVSRSGETCTTL